MPRIRQLTTTLYGKILTNHAVWSPDGQWIVYDTRSDPLGNRFDGERIERVHVDTGRVEILFRSQHGAHCGVVTYHPHDERVIFIHGPEQPTPDWSYCAWHRRGVIVETQQPNLATTVDACNVVPPFTRGALRGGSHVHVWSPAGDWISFTYEDHLLASADRAAGDHAELNQRNICISIPDHPVRVPATHPRHHNGSHFSVLVTETWDDPLPGTEQICRACEEGWIGTHGYHRRDGSRQERALAFLGTVAHANGTTHAEVFVVDLPDDLLQRTTDLSCGTLTTRPRPPQGVQQRRLTWTDNRAAPGIAGPRHWLRSSPNGDRIGFYQRDQRGVVQFWTIDPNGGEPQQLSDHATDITSAFSWHPTGNSVAYAVAGQLVVMQIATGQSQSFSIDRDDVGSILPLAVVWSPQGDRLVFVCPVLAAQQSWNQLFLAEL